MSTVLLSVPGISCENCERHVTEALTKESGVQSVKVNIPEKVVTLTYDEGSISIDQVKAILEEEEYPVASVSAA